MNEKYNNDKYEYYCTKCGQIHFFSLDNDHMCLVCHTQMIETPHEYGLTEETMYNDYQLFQQQEQRLFDEIISKSPEFDINFYNNKDSILQQRQQQQDESIARGKAILEGRNKGNKYGVECPYCHATNVKKITNTSKAVHTALFGLFSMSRNSKQWHCNNCGSDF